MVGALMSQDTLPLLRLRPADVARRVLVVGDPARAGKAAAMLDDAEKIGDNREYVTWSGRFCDRRVCVVSHGVGAAGARLASEELTRYPHIGSCGTVTV